MIALLLVPLAVVALVWFVAWYRRDCERVDRINFKLVDMSLASRATKLSECSPTFLTRLREVLDSRDGDQP